MDGFNCIYYLRAHHVHYIFDPQEQFICYINKNFYHAITALITGFFTAISIVYWQASKIYHQKWRYCSDLYNKIISINPYEQEKYRILSNALAIDLVLLDLWSHRSFKELFRDELETAIKHYKCNSPHPSLSDKVNKRQLSEKEALEILQANQDRLMKN